MLHMFDPRPLAFGGRSELMNSSDKKWQAKKKKEKKGILQDKNGNVKTRKTKKKTEPGYP